MSDLPVVVVGAGPQGLAAAAHLIEREIDVMVIERGHGPAASVSEWGHVRLFSAWDELVDAAAARLLEREGRRAPARGYPTGAEWVAEYLAPLARALAGRVRYATNVTGIARQGRDKTIDGERAQQPFVVHAVDGDGAPSRLLARAVIDASGTWTRPNVAGAEGLAAVGEADAADRISYRSRADVSALAGSHIAVIGSGHSAAHVILQLSELVRSDPSTRVTWMLRRGHAANVFGGGAGDELPERAALGSRARRVVDDGLVRLTTGFRVSEFRRENGHLTVVSDDGREVAGVSHVFALTGFRPDTGILSELRIDLDPALEAVAGIAAEIDPNLHSCGSVAATGARQLVHPEHGFFIVGAKSYGRAPTFLALTGYEQVRSVVADLAGDHEAAMRNELVLPSTGVCGGSGGFESAGGSCCGEPARARAVLKPPTLEVWREY